MKILLVGACGRMGREVSALASSRGHEVVCGVDLSPAQMPYPVYASFAGIRENSDFIIDFSSAAGHPAKSVGQAEKQKISESKKEREGENVSERKGEEGRERERKGEKGVRARRREGE